MAGGGADAGGTGEASPQIRGGQAGLLLDEVEDSLSNRVLQEFVAFNSEAHEA